MTEPVDYSQIGGLLADPEKLKALLASLAPQDKANFHGLAQAGFALMNAKKGQELPAIGQAGLLGMQGKQAYLDDSMKRAMAGMTVSRGMAEAQQYQAKQQELAADQSFLKGYKPPVGPQLPSMAPTNANAQALAQQPQFGTYERLLDMANKAEDAGRVKLAQDYRVMAEKYAPQYGDTETLMKDGKPVVLQKYKNRAPTEMTGYEPKPDMAEVDLGGTKQFVNRYTIPSGGMTLAKSMTPDAVASNKLGYAGLAQSDRHFNTSQATQAAGQTAAQQARVAEQVHTIRKEMNALPEVQGYRAVVPMLNSAAQAPDTRSGDLDIIYAVGKALDPGSVVREGELNLVIKSGTLPQQVEGAASYVMGGGKLPPAQRQELLSMLTNRAAQLKKSHDTAMTPFVAQAKANGLPADQLFITPPEVNTAPKSGPRPGDVVGGFVFKGGDPNKKENWKEQ